jgi:DNA-binding Xre family transcriptional regulator
MQVSYKKLFKLLIDRDMNKTDLRKLASLSPTTLAKLSKNELLSMEVLIRICMVLNVTFDEIMEISPHEEMNKKT